MEKAKRKPDGFELREALGDKYWKDKRWAKVKHLREKGKHMEANKLVDAIRTSWGIE